MSGIFISYRRIDTTAWAGRLFDYLSRHFGRPQVFMDIEGSILRGANFEQVLTTGLEQCDCLLALIGPQWISCERSVGRRRLEEPDDWVRNEIATALRRNVPVFPVLFNNAPIPEKEDLPEDLRPLSLIQVSKVDDGEHWGFDVGKIIEAIENRTKLKQVDTVVAARTGIELLKELMTRIPTVANAVILSKEVIENSFQQTNRLELYKKLHDALHDIEFDCLRPLQAGAFNGHLHRCEIRFNRILQQINNAIAGTDLDVGLRDDLEYYLHLVTDAFREEMDAPEESSYGLVMDRLRELLSSLPTSLNSFICSAARQINLTRLIELITNVQSILAEESSEHDAAYMTLAESIGGFQASCADLERRITEHNRLQGLDSKLRTVCCSGIIADGVVADEWRRIKEKRSRLTPPFTPEFNNWIGELDDLENEIDATIGQSDESPAKQLLCNYFWSVSKTFRAADTGLKDFCIRLSVLGHSLRIILNMCANGG